MWNIGILRDFRPNSLHLPAVQSCCDSGVNANTACSGVEQSQLAELTCS